MRLHRFIAPALMAVGFVAVDRAAAAELIQLNSFTAVPQLSNELMEMLCIDAPVIAAGQPAMIYAENAPLMPVVLVPGPGLYPVPQRHPRTYTVAGPMIAAKILVMGSN